MTLKVVAGTDITIRYAFRPSVLEKEGIKVWYKRTPQRCFSWRRFRFVNVTRVTEVWTDDEGDFEPGNSWIDWGM